MKRKKIWTEKTSSLGVAIRTPNDIKEKWNNLKKEAKKVFTNQTRVRKNRRRSKT